ncbi:oxepin-CoA hydrolase, alternative type [Azospirillum doebereinerae]|uniref:Enoyl-CoA hydratase n=1 Tax=Azospirillum doebereinerae TaxID=92933 RepID=A0A433JER7_9PROT|nr:enoyl-CoA hydratase family protein [Azospirillum doebereinerae]MCG5239146.1 enoyl-CoA hydratase family protein [Azospirillum doebereinerae]RUQ75661.1 enoyl-CoA hydratase [Azospirillum doebereinerae]
MTEQTNGADAATTAVTTVERQGRVMVLTMTDPATRNALSVPMMARARDALDEAAHDHGIGAIVLTGAGGAFSSGGHLTNLYHHGSKSRSENRDGIERFHGWVRAMRECPKPIVAAVEGPAAGAGFSLALACDLIVAAEDARFLTAYVKVGLTSDGGASASLARALPPQLYAELMLTGGPVEAARLHAAGVVNRVTAPGRALAEAVAWAETIAEGPAGAMGRAKKLMELAYGSFATQLARESDLFVEALHHGEAKEGITAFFDKRPPVFHKR